jgi:hypothetical protein
MIRLLLFAEDAGAAAFIAPLLGPLSKAGFRCRLVATAVAATRLASWGIKFEAPSDCLSELVAATDMVATGTAISANTSGLKLIAEARTLGMATVGFADSHQHMEWRFRGDTDIPTAFAPDWLIVPDEIARRRAVEVGFEAHAVVVAGHPSFDRVRGRIGTPELLRDARSARDRIFGSAGRDMVLFVTEPSVNVYGGSFTRTADYTLEGDPTSKFRTDIVLDEFLVALSACPERPISVLRPHPASTEAEFAKHAAKFDLCDRSADPLPLVCGATVVVGMSSIVLLEAALLGRPTLSVVPRPLEATWSASVQAGVTPCVWTRETLIETLRKAVETPTYPDPSLLERHFPAGAGDRIASFFKTLASKKPRNGDLPPGARESMGNG